MIGFCTQLLSFKKDGISLILSAAQMEGTFALNVLQKLDHCFKLHFFLQYYKTSQILKADSFSQTQVLLISKVMVVHFLILFYITSWKTWNLPYQSLQVLRKVEQKCLSSSLLMRPILLKKHRMKSFAIKEMSCAARVFNCRPSQGDALSGRLVS